MYTEF